ncbi:MAG: SDR family NAD(P)-dependent oxidoreductase [Desulfuromonadales bacterium]|nr:SDR family NAD(P)-dependent oxidoreductase [Desulfuromonadales bacterium]
MTDHHQRPVLITGGAGFIGTNLADRLAREKVRLIILDNLSRSGVQENLAWLRACHGEQVAARIVDIRDPQAVATAVSEVSQVFHFAAQVAVTTSLLRPVEDFEINARGTLNLLEALRALTDPPPLVFTSTNKVYGQLGQVELLEAEERYFPDDPAIRSNGISERQPLDFHSPYGCSKGTAEQYVLDYARIFRLPTVVFRMSCIYGPHQHGTEDQGWVAHFLLRALRREAITLYGNGKQVRDLLFIDDLVDALLLAQRQIDRLAGKAFNIGGGPANSISLLELLAMIADLEGRSPKIHHQTERPGDQAFYVSDTRRFKQLTGWKPRTGVGEGVKQLHTWLRENRLGSPTTAPRAKAGFG